MSDDNVMAEIVERYSGDITYSPSVITVAPPTPDLPLDGRWHRWNGRRLATLTPDGAFVIKKVSRACWLFRYGGAIQRLFNAAP